MEKLTFNEKKIISEYIRRMQKQFPKQISKSILFGSKARGDSHQRSDIDILVVLNTDDEKVKGRIQDLSWDVMMDYNFTSFLSPIVFLKKQHRQYKKWNSSFLSVISREGLLL